jgi:hypothetical protein
MCIRDRIAKWAPFTLNDEELTGYGKLEYAQEEAPTLLQAAIDYVYQGLFTPQAE